MSILRDERGTCACGVAYVIPLVDSINASRHPHLRARVLDGTLHRHRCACGRELVLERDLFYFDFARRQFLGVYPPRDLVDADLRARELVSIFETTLRDSAPAAVAATAEEFLVRVCFGYDELREKLLLDEAGLSDLALEELKCRVLVGDPRFRQAGVVTLWLDAVTETALRLHPAAVSGPPAIPDVVVERAVYEDICAAGDDAILAARPGLASGPHVSLLRLVRWDLAGPGQHAD